MGFSSWFKSLFSKTIKDKSSDGDLISLAVKNSSVKIGREIEVKPKHSAVVAVRGKVCDVFAEGRYRLEPKTMPLTARVCKLSKPNKKGELPQKFNADIYFVNLNVLPATFVASSFVTAKDQLIGKAKAQLCGQFEFSISNPVDFLEALQTQFGIISNSVALEEVESWVADLATRAVQKNKPTLKSLFEKNQVCFAGVQDYVNQELFDCGVKVQNLKVLEVNFPRKVTKILQAQTQQSVPEESQNNVQKAQEEQFKRESSNVYADEANKIQSQMSQKTYTIDSSGKSQIDAYAIPVQNEQQASAQTYNIDGATMSQKENRPEIATHQAEETTNHSNIEAQSDVPIQKTIRYKKCSNCGALNSADSEICFSCKAKLK